MGVLATAANKKNIISCEKSGVIPNVPYPGAMGSCICREAEAAEAADSCDFGLFGSDLVSAHFY